MDTAMFRYGIRERGRMVHIYGVLYTPKNRETDNDDKILKKCTRCPLCHPQ